MAFVSICDMNESQFMDFVHDLYHQKECMDSIEDDAVMETKEYKSLIAKINRYERYATLKGYQI